MNQVPVSESTRVFLNFSISLEDGSEVDSNFGGDSVNFVIGDGSLLPGFERLLFGMSPGERQMFVVPPENAFGQPNNNNLQYLPKDQFDEDEDLEEDDPIIGDQWREGSGKPLGLPERSEL